MRHAIRVLFATAALGVAALPIAGQQFVPQAIQFVGLPDYSEKDLLAASGLKTGTVMTADAMTGCMKRLADTGLFEKLGYSFDGAKLVVTLSDSSQLFAVRLENIPLAPGFDLEAKLHEKLPLYHGKVPSEGGMLESVKQTLVEILAAEGIEATILAAPFTDMAQNKVTAMTFAETEPPVQIGDIVPDPASAPLDPKALELLPKITGTAYSNRESPETIQGTLGDFYRNQGYLEASVSAVQKTAPVIAPDVVRVPFVVSATPGKLYKIAGMQLAPDMLVAQAEFDKQSHIHPGDVADGERVRDNLHYLDRQYHNKGFILARIIATPSYDRANGTVSYAVSAEPGQQFTMGALTIENVTDELRGAMYSVWKMPAGAVFNEGAILNFFTSGNANPKLERVFAVADIKYTLKPDMDTHKVDVVLRLEKKH
jgi:outer membrane protein assembly factor BamA